MTVSARRVEEILVISVTGRMTRWGGIAGLLSTVKEAVQLGGGKILLDLDPQKWDSYGFEILDSAIQTIGSHQERVVCRFGPIPIKDVRWMKSVYSKADCFDTLDEALARLRKDC